jgi:hypothetical protein
MHTPDFMVAVWPVISGGAAALVLSAVARALPEPLPMGSRLYLFFYRFAQIMLANFDKSHPPEGLPSAASPPEPKP